MRERTERDERENGEGLRGMREREIKKMEFCILRRKTNCLFKELVAANT